MWREAGTAPPHAAELAALYSAYHRRLEALGALDADGLARAALDKLREAWDGRPLLLYGFDDLTPAQLDLVETLVRHTDTEVTVALSYEPGRAALAGSAATVELLKPLAREHVVLDARSEHYAPSARGALHHLERSLFEDEPARVPPNGAVRLLEAGGERAEAELVGASVLELLRDGMAPEDIAVLVRANADLFAQVLEGYAIPVARERRTAFEHTRLGTGVLAFARAALEGGTANDVVTWLRTPGKDAPMADRLEVQVRRNEARTARDARYRWAPDRRRGPDRARRPRRRGAGGRRAVPERARRRGRRDLDRAPRPPRGRAQPRGRGRRPRGAGAARGGQGADPAPRARSGARRRP